MSANRCQAEAGAWHIPSTCSFIELGVQVQRQDRRAGNISHALNVVVVVSQWVSRLRLASLCPSATYLLQEQSEHQSDVEGLRFPFCSQSQTLNQSSFVFHMKQSTSNQLSELSVLLRLDCNPRTSMKLSAPTFVWQEHCSKTL